jgi:glycosyltransferase involved in cell wall biosynthesis
MSGERDATPRAIYIGDLRQSRGLHEMLEVADLTTKWNFDFIGEIAEADREYVERWQVTSPAIGRVRFHGKLPPHEAWAFAKGAWVGLSLLQSTPAFVEAVPSKLYEYMSVGLAIISTPLPRCIEIINESNSGAIASSAKFVSSQLNAWEENPMELDQARKEALLWANEHLDSEQEYATFAAEMRKLTR